LATSASSTSAASAMTASAAETWAIGIEIGGSAIRLATHPNVSWTRDRHIRDVEIGDGKVVLSLVVNMGANRRRLAPIELVMRKQVARKLTMY
jgi:hypothetical protein